MGDIKTISDLVANKEKIMDFTEYCPDDAFIIGPIGMYTILLNAHGHFYFLY